ncbi:TPA: electron transport complex subunit RsxC, partial [Providencia alcalifaciens]
KAAAQQTSEPVIDAPVEVAEEVDPRKAAVAAAIARAKAKKAAAQQTSEPVIDAPVETAEEVDPRKAAVAAAIARVKAKKAAQSSVSQQPNEQTTTE